MKKAKLPLDEALRLSDLDAYEILDTVNEKDFDELVELLRHITQCSYVAISFLDTHRQWHKAQQGLPSSSHARDLSFCSHTILDKKVMVVPDALRDERFHDNPLVTDHLRIRFYAGVPIVSANGRNIGTVCAFDSELKPFTPEQERAIEIISHQVTRLLELRIRNRRAIRKAEEMLEMERKTLEYTLQAQEEERRAFGVELHENFAQVIAACLLYMNLALESQEPNRNMVIKARHEMMELLQEMRRLSRTYNPINMPVVSLEEVVKEFLDQFNDGKIQVKLNWQDKLVDLPNEVALILFRVMDGYLRLIRDSGRNGHVGIHISAQDDLDIEIVDDVPYDNSLGSEFEIGLNAILSRIDILEGRYSLECEPGKPHCFKVKLPFPLSIAC